jgi:site-specific DNA-methyltransferase (adenine-specific)/modification methylase
MITAELWQGDCFEVMKTLYINNIKAVITDPPYGIDYAHGPSHCSNKKVSTRFVNDTLMKNNKPFDPTPFLSFNIVVLFGANYYADKLPISGGWVVWDKLNGLTSKRTWGFNDNSDCEFIWTNVGNTARIVRHRWMGIIRESENGKRHVHPTQKPVALMVKLIEHYTKPNDIVFDPFMGSGTTGVACMQTNRNFIGIERDSKYFDIAYKRINDASQKFKG